MRDTLPVAPKPPDPKPPDPKPPDPKPPDPVTPKRVPAAWLPNAEEITLLQEYLTGKRPGLVHCGYDLGAYGPDGDGVDGVNGGKTKEAIRSFQRDHGGLAVDGVYGPKTAAGFDEELNPKT
jgi:peptidoglycan hydrolase-like protein with peptidoglycan-binding domain